MSNVSISSQLRKKLDTDEEFCKKLDSIANGQIIIFIKHCKINLDRTIKDDTWEVKINN